MRTTLFFSLLLIPALAGAQTSRFRETTERGSAAAP
jgi:hypothetical protein